jgi:hypothetical protein
MKIKILFRACNRFTHRFDDGKEGALPKERERERAVDVNLDVPPVTLRVFLATQSPDAEEPIREYFMSAPTQPC